MFHIPKVLAWKLQILSFSTKNPKKNLLHTSIVPIVRNGLEKVSKKKIQLLPMI